MKATHIRSDESPCKSMLVLPPEVIVEIVKRTFTDIEFNDRTTLRALAAVSKGLRGILQAHREAIVDHFTTTTTSSDGKTTSYWFCGMCHREGDRPAVEGVNYIWRQYNNLHRSNDKPAVVGRTGYRAWYWRGERHRDNDLPAIIYSTGAKEYWIHGRYVRRERAY